jgi:hypothetical protein
LKLFCKKKKEQYYYLLKSLLQQETAECGIILPAMVSTSGRLHSEFVRLLFLQTHRETDRFFIVSGVQSAQSTSGQFHFRRTACPQHLKGKVDLTLVEAAAFRVNLNLDGASIASKSHTHPSHSQTSRLLTSSLSLGFPVPRPTQCVRDV